MARILTPRTAAKKALTPMIGFSLGVTNGWRPPSTPAPTLNATPQSGVWRAHSVTFGGTNLTGCTGLTIGGVAQTVTGSTSTTVTVTTSVQTANASGLNVVATTAAGNSGTTGNGIYSVAGDYLDIPSAKVLFCLDPAVGVNLGAKTITDAVHGNVFTALSAMSVDSSGLNGQKRLVYPTSNAGANGLTCAGLTSSATKAQAFAIGAVSAVNDNCIWGNNNGNTSFFGFGGAIYEAFGTTARKDSIGSITPPTNFAYEVVADASGNWQAILNGLTIDTVTGNTVAWPSGSVPNTVDIGYNSNNAANFYLDGEIDFVLWLVDNLSAAEETMMTAYIATRWGVTFNRSGNIRGYGHSIAAGGNASNIGTTDMYPRTIQGLQAAQPQRWSLSYVGHPSQHCAQWTGNIASEITPYFVSGVANAKGPVNIFALIEVINSATFYCAALTTGWIASTPYALGAYNVPTVSNGFYYQASSISGSGTSGSSQPAWPTTIGATVTDNAGANQIVWTCVGALTSVGAIAGALGLADHIAFLTAVKAAQPNWYCVAYCMYIIYNSTAQQIAAIQAINAGLVAAVGGGIVDAVVRLDLDSDFIPPGPPPTTYVDDGTHPTDAGHQEIANDGIPVYEALYAAHA